MNRTKGSKRVKDLMAAILCELLAAPLMEAGVVHAQPAAEPSAVCAGAGSTGNLWVLAMEITQATQPWMAVNRQTKSLMPVAIEYSPEAIPLVRGKRTVVRVYPGLEGASPVMTGVEAALTCQASTSTSTSPAAPCPGPAVIMPSAPILVDQAYGNDPALLQLDAARTWNFVLPDAWTAQPAPIRLTATITASEDQPECYPCHDRANSLTLSGLAFNLVAPLRLNVVYGCVRRKAGDPQSACDTAPLDTHTALFASGDSLVVQTFPLAANDFQVSLRPPITLPVDGDPYYDGAMTAERVADFQRMVCELAAQSDGGQAPLNEITVGLLPGPTMGMLGKGRPHCITVVVEKGTPAKALPRAAELVAEELGHALGRPHAGCNVHVNPEGAPCEPTIQQFPCAHGGICTPGFDTVALRVIDPGHPPAEPHAHDFMSYGDGVQWISPYTYRRLYEALRALAVAGP